MIRLLFGSYLNRKPGLSLIFLLIAIFACSAGIIPLSLGIPATWMQSQTIAKLSQPTAAEALQLSPGTEALFTVQLPETAPTESHGLALYQTRIWPQPPTPSSTTMTSPLELPATDQITATLTDGTAVRLQIRSNANFANAETLRFEEGDHSISYIGYRPGQTLTARGIWEGHFLITVKDLYAGTPAAYLDYLKKQPGQIFCIGSSCGLFGILFWSIAGALRKLGK